MKRFYVQIFNGHPICGAIELDESAPAIKTLNMLPSNFDQFNGQTMEIVSRSIVDNEVIYVFKQKEVHENPITADDFRKKAREQISVGNRLSDELTELVFAENELLASQNQALTTSQIQSLVSVSLTIDRALRTGALETSKEIISQMIISFPQYANAGNYIISEINIYFQNQQ